MLLASHLSVWFAHGGGFLLLSCLFCIWDLVDLLLFDYLPLCVADIFNVSASGDLLKMNC